jgi:PII-like signaling protein
MKLEGEQILFRVFLKAGEKYAHIVPLYRHLVKRLKEERIAGATVVKGVSGFLEDKEVLRETFLKPHHVPVCIETVDSPEKINGFIEKESTIKN